MDPEVIAESGSQPSRISGSSSTISRLGSVGKCVQLARIKIGMVCEHNGKRAELNGGGEGDVKWGSGLSLTRGLRMHRSTYHLLFSIPRVV